jgi:hypothetical protein
MASTRMAEPEGACHGFRKAKFAEIDQKKPKIRKKLSRKKGKSWTRRRCARAAGSPSAQVPRAGRQGARPRWDQPGRPAPSGAGAREPRGPLQEAQRSPLTGSLAKRRQRVGKPREPRGGGEERRVERPDARRAIEARAWRGRSRGARAARPRRPRLPQRKTRYPTRFARFSGASGHPIAFPGPGHRMALFVSVSAGSRSWS